MKDLCDSNTVIHSIEWNLYDFYDKICLLSDTARYEKKNNWTSLITGIHHPLCNGIINPRLHPLHSEEQIKEAMVPFSEQQLPMIWWIGPSAKPANLPLHLENNGLIKADTAPGMAMKLSSLTKDTLPGNIEIRHATTPQELKDWDTIFSTVFSLPPDAVAFFSEPFSIMVSKHSNQFQQLIVYLDGKPMACGSFFISAGVGGVYNIGTLQEARGNGIGTAITSAGLNWFRKNGIDVAILQSSAMGLSVYNRLGFRQFCDFYLYTNKFYI